MERVTCVAIAAAMAGCFGMAKSKGGGEISRGAAEEPRVVAASDVVVPPGYRIEAVTRGLTFPTGIAFGQHGELYVVESGYAYGEVFTEPRLLELSPSGAQVRVIATGDHAPWTGVAYHDGVFYVAQGGALEGGRIVRIELDGRQQVLVDGLPSQGDHHTNGPAISRDGWVYFGQGTVTNSGVVGPDNAALGWLERQPALHDVPCQDVRLRGVDFTGPDPRTPDDDETTTGAYARFGTRSEPGQVVRGRVPCNGAVLRVKATGGDVELVAWGFRNPFGLAFGPDGALYVTDNGADVRGSRPVFGSADVLWKVEPGRWYGWPDFSEGRPLTREQYSEADGDTRGFILAEHPGEPPAPVAYLPVHASADGFDVSRSESFGHVGSAFIALFGDMAPSVGKVLAPVGFNVVRVDLRTGLVEDFARNAGDRGGPASKLGTAGLERPVAARFDPSGAALYVVDFGVLRQTEDGSSPQVATGAIWRITRAGETP